MKLQRRKIKRGRIEIIPMIDTILILLIFYMSFSTLTRREKQIDAKLPFISSGTIAPPTTEILDLLLHVHDRERITVNGQEETPYSLPDLQSFLNQYSAIGQEMTVIIQGDANTAYQDIVSALDVCAVAKLTRVAFRPIGHGAGATESER
jgi:biopolymer transport protein ExbD